MRLATTLLSTCAALALAACATEAPPGEPVGFGRAVAVLEEEARLRGSEHGLLAIDAIAVRSDGGVAALQRRIATVRVFSPDGIPIGAFGGYGDGEGTFLNPSHLGWWGDTLWVFDAARRRLTLVEPGLTPADTIAGAPPGLLAVTRDRRAVGTRYLEGRSVLAATDLATGEVTELLALPPAGRAPGIGADAGAATGADGEPARTTHYAVSPDGGRVAVAVAGAGALGAGALALLVTTLGGDTLIARSYELPGAPVAGATHTPGSAGPPDSRLLAPDSPPGAAPGGPGAGDRLPDATGGGSGAATAATSAGAGAPPAVTGLLVADDGAVWVERWLWTGEREYLVVDPAGEPLGSLVVPGDQRVITVEGERAWLVASSPTGAHDVVRVRVLWE